MSSFVVDTRGLIVPEQKLRRLSVLDTIDLLDVIGAVIESQTRRRIDKEKKDPSGQNWVDLTPDYERWKRTRSSGGILDLFGYLKDSIGYNATSGEIEVGSNLVYAAVHQYGDMGEGSARAGSQSGGTPARPYLGLSDENVDELQKVVNDWFEEQMR